MSESRSHEIWLERALDLAAQASSLDEVPVGAIIVDSAGMQIGEGFNLREQNQDPTAHAEVLAIQAAARKLGSWRLVDCTLYVTLEPCPMCLAACQQARVGSIFYGARDPKGGALSLGYEFHTDQRFNHRFAATYLEVPRCGTILSEFFSRKRKS